MDLQNAVNSLKENQNFDTSIRFFLSWCNKDVFEDT